MDNNDLYPNGRPQNWGEVRDLCDRLGIPFEVVRRPTVQETLEAIEAYRRGRGW